MKKALDDDSKLMKPTQAQRLSTGASRLPAQQDSAALACELTKAEVHPATSAAPTKPKTGIQETVPTACMPEGNWEVHCPSAQCMNIEPPLAAPSDPEKGAVSEQPSSSKGPAENTSMPPPKKIKVASGVQVF